MLDEELFKKNLFLIEVNLFKRKFSFTQEGSS